MFSYGIIPNIGVPELILILVVVLVIFGPGKLPELGKTVGQGIKEFRKATTNFKEDIVEEVEESKVK